HEFSTPSQTFHSPRTSSALPRTSSTPSRTTFHSPRTTFHSPRTSSTPSRTTFPLPRSRWAYFSMKHAHRRTNPSPFPIPELTPHQSQKSCDEFIATPLFQTLYILVYQN